MSNAITATPFNIERLLDKLYEVQRELQSAGQGDIKTFVLVTASNPERQAVEAIMFGYLGVKYGFDVNAEMPYDLHPLKTGSTFRFPNGVVITLIDIE